MNLKNKLIKKIVKKGAEKPGLYKLSFIVVGLLTTVLGSHLLNAYRGKDNFLNLNEEYENMLGV